MAHEIAEKMLLKVTKQRCGPGFDAAMKTGVAYWLKVLRGSDSWAEKQAYDAAVSAMLGCDVQISGQRSGLVQRVLRRLHDSVTAKNKG